MGEKRRHRGEARRSLEDQDADLPLVFVRPGGIACFEWQAIREEAAIVIDVRGDRDLADDAIAALPTSATCGSGPRWRTVGAFRPVGAFLDAIAAPREGGSWNCPQAVIHERRRRAPGEAA